MDYGNKEEITVPVREMSEAMKKIPAQAIRCTIDAGSEGICDKIAIEQVFEVFVKKRVSMLIFSSFLYAHLAMAVNIYDLEALFFVFDCLFVVNYCILVVMLYYIRFSKKKTHQI